MSERTTGAEIAAAKAFRSALQSVGISSATPWAEIGPQRQYRHIRAVQAMRETDHRIIGPDDLAALRRIHALVVAAQAFIETVSPWDYIDDDADVMISRHTIDLLWNAEALVSDGHDDRRLAALIGDDNG
jgi:hypothetical protein